MDQLPVGARLASEWFHVAAGTLLISLHGSKPESAPLQYFGTTAAEFQGRNGWTSLCENLESNDDGNRTGEDPEPVEPNGQG